MRPSQSKCDVHRETSRQATLGWTVQSTDHWVLVSVEDLDEGQSSQLDFLVDVESGRVLKSFTSLDETSNKLEVLITKKSTMEAIYFSTAHSKGSLSVKRRKDRLSFPLPLTLKPGHHYRVGVELLHGEREGDARLIRCRQNEKSMTTEFRAVLTRPELKLLHSKADVFVHRAITTSSTDGYEFSPFHWFYRNKPPVYYDDILTRYGGLMLPYLKDNNGDPACPINRQMDGLFFGVSVTRSSGSLPSQSPFGSRRLCVDWRWMFNTAPNLYFADFYCNTRPHYVTLVMTRKGSKTDVFCRRHLVGPLDLHANPFLRLAENAECAVVNANVTVEVFFTESVDVIRLIHAGLATLYDTASTGTSRPEGIPKRLDCTVCNLYQTADKFIGNATDEVVTKKMDEIVIKEIDEIVTKPQ